MPVCSLSSSPWTPAPENHCSAFTAVSTFLKCYICGSVFSFVSSFHPGMLLRFAPFVALSVVHYFWFLNSTPLYASTLIFSRSHVGGYRVISSFFLLWKVLLRTLTCKSLCGHASISLVYPIFIYILLCIIYVYFKIFPKENLIYILWEILHYTLYVKLKANMTEQRAEKLGANGGAANKKSFLKFIYSMYKRDRESSRSPDRALMSCSTSSFV